MILWAVRLYFLSDQTRKYTNTIIIIRKYDALRKEI